MYTSDVGSNSYVLIIYYVDHKIDAGKSESPKEGVGYRRYI